MAARGEQPPSGLHAPRSSSPKQSAAEVGGRYSNTSGAPSCLLPWTEAIWTQERVIVSPVLLLAACSMLLSEFVDGQLGKAACAVAASRKGSRASCPIAFDLHGDLE